MYCWCVERSQRALSFAFVSRVVVSLMGRAVKNNTELAHLYKCNLLSSLSTTLLFRQLIVYIRPSETQSREILSAKGLNHETDPW